MVPCLLHSWLKKRHIAPRVYTELQQHFLDSIDDADDNPQQVIDAVVMSFAKVAKSNSIIMGTNVDRRDRDRMLDIIVDARSGFRLLYQLLARVYQRDEDDDHPRRNHSSISRTQSLSPQESRVQSSSPQEPPSDAATDDASDRPEGGMASSSISDDRSGMEGQQDVSFYALA